MFDPENIDYLEGGVRYNCIENWKKYKKE